MAMDGLDPNISQQLEMSESGDGSDRDLEELADLVSNLSEQVFNDKCTNPGMQTMAAMMMEKVNEQCANMLNGDRPEPEEIWSAIESVHSYSTARSCMTEAVSSVCQLLDRAFEMMIAHEAEEGNFTFEGTGVLRG
jgi:hypothetical protein